MSVVAGKHLAWGIIIAGGLGAASALEAQMPVGTWVRQPIPNMPEITMTVEACCGGGRRLIYHIAGEGKKMLLTVESRFDGKDAPVSIDGKVTAETMAIKVVDDHHANTVLKMNGTFFGTANGTLSADGKTITVLNDYSSSAGGQPVGKYTEVWVKK